MTSYRLFTAILAIIVIACLSGVQGQPQTQDAAHPNRYAVNAPSSAQNPAQYSLSYTMPTVSAHISAPVQTAIAGNMPVPYSHTEGPSLWIQGWTHYAAVPQGATINLLAISPTGDNGYLSEIFNGATYNFSFHFYPNSQLTFTADKIGTHTLFFSMNGRSSNQVVIDVTSGTYQPNDYQPPTNYYQGYNPRCYNPVVWPWDYYSWYNCRCDSCGFYPDKYYLWD